MDAINWLLINGAGAGHWLWDVIVTFFGAVFAVCQAVLNPVLSPLLSLVTPICTVLGDALYTLLSPLPIWLGLTLLSVAGGVVMLIAFRYTSNQAGIGRARDDISAHLLALKLFKENVRVTFRAQGRLLKALLRLQWHLLRPVLIMLLPMLLALAQMGVRYQHRPLRPGEQTLIRLRLKPHQAEAPAAELEPSPGITESVGPVPGGGELVWRIRAGQPGRYTLRLNVGGHEVEKELVVGEGLQRVSAVRPGHRWTTQILHPVEAPLPTDWPAESVEVLYADIDSWACGTDTWVVYFFVVSMISALLLKPFFRVRF